MRAATIWGQGSSKQITLKKVKIDQKSLKTDEKKVLTSFQVRAAPESWSKYTTVDPIVLIFLSGIFEFALRRCLVCNAYLNFVSTNILAMRNYTSVGINRHHA